MNPRRRVSAAALAAAMLFAAGLPAVAEGGSAHLEAAWAAAVGEIEGVIDAGELSTINQVAYQAAVARLCDGFDLDVEEIAAVTNTMLGGGPADLDATAQVARHTEILIALGTVHGLFLAEGSRHHDRFCAEATEARDAPGFDHHWR